MANSKSIKLRIYKTGVITISSCIFFFLFLFICSKYIRQSLPPPQILDNKIVGFSQFFGYPLYFDFYLFFLILFIPVITFFIFYFLEFKNEKN